MNVDKYSQAPENNNFGETFHNSNSDRFGLSSHTPRRDNKFRLQLFSWKNKYFALEKTTQFEGHEWDLISDPDIYQYKNEGRKCRYESDSWNTDEKFVRRNSYRNGRYELKISSTSRMWHNKRSITRRPFLREAAGSADTYTTLVARFFFF